MTDFREAGQRARIVQKLVPQAWDRGPISLAHEIRNMLKAMVDEGTQIDSCGGDGVADLWPTIGGVEYHIQIRTRGSGAR
jgi:hypothetical protein